VATTLVTSSAEGTLPAPIASLPIARSKHTTAGPRRCATGQRLKLFHKREVLSRGRGRSRAGSLVSHRRNVPVLLLTGLIDSSSGSIPRVRSQSTLAMFWQRLKRWRGDVMSARRAACHRSTALAAASSMSPSRSGFMNISTSMAAERITPSWAATLRSRRCVVRYWTHRCTARAAPSVHPGAWLAVIPRCTRRPE
jgi:hypothetical protein